MAERNFLKNRLPRGGKRTRPSIGSAIAKGCAAGDNCISAHPARDCLALPRTRQSTWGAKV